jgi:hypothetical protein
LKTIFIQIAAYRDPELQATITDCLTKAKDQKNLKFCIAWQHCKEEKWDKLDQFVKDERFIILDIPFEESKGVCWARNKIQQFYNNETYSLQIDSHTRFVQDWDIELINMHELLLSKGHQKPVISTYAPFYNPREEPRLFPPTAMVFERFTKGGAVLFTQLYIYDRKITAPIPAKFYSAHFCFAAGAFCKEVPHDPDYYFHGEEISIAARAYTHGYDFFHPNKTILYHQYFRNGVSRHWQDNLDWLELEKKSLFRNRVLLGMEDGEIDFGVFGLGGIRSLEDYENYTGLNFKVRKNFSKAPG